MRSRRRFIVSAAASLALPCTLMAQRRRPRVGIAVSDAVPAYIDAFKAELARVGGDHGMGFDVLVADGEGDPQKLPAAIANLVGWQPDVIISSSNRTHFVLRDATSTIPVILVSAIDPVALGVSDSIARPSRNFTGSMGFVDGLMEKRVEFLKEVLPAARRIALHLDPANPAFPATHRGAAEAARRLGIEVVVAGYARRSDVVPALDQAKAQDADAVIVLPDGIALGQMGAIAMRANALGLPTLGLNDNELRLGLTFVVGSDRIRLWREAAVMADKILRGAKIADIPFEQPTKVHIGVNLKAARSLGLTVPLDIIARADEVIE